MGTFIDWMAYLLTFLLYSAALLVALDWTAHRLPGAGLNPLRRGLFRLLYPLRRVGDLLGLRTPGFDLTAPLLIVLLLGLGRYGLPWLVLWGAALKG